MNGKICLCFKKTLSLLCRQAEDLEGIEGGGQGDLLRGLVQVGGDHLDGDRQGARLVSLKGAISLKESDGSLSEAILDMLWKFRCSCVRVHEGSVGFHQELVQRDHPLLQDSAYSIFRLVLPQVASQPNVAAELEVFDGLLTVPGEAVNNTRGKAVDKPFKDANHLRVSVTLMQEQGFSQFTSQ